MKIPVYVLLRLSIRVESYFTDKLIEWVLPDRCERSEMDFRYCPVGLYRDQAVSERVRLQREQQARHEFADPFLLAHNRYQLATSLDPLTLHSKVLELGVIPPEKDWHTWWHAHSPSWSEETFQGIWELFDKVRFYRTIKLFLEE
jgi:hypothetical protein